MNGKSILVLTVPRLHAPQIRVTACINASTSVPTPSPTMMHSQSPTLMPSRFPTLMPSQSPSIISPSYYPTEIPIFNPAHFPTFVPSQYLSAMTSAPDTWTTTDQSKSQTNVNTIWIIIAVIVTVSCCGIVLAMLLCCKKSKYKRISKENDGKSKDIAVNDQKPVLKIN